MIEAQSKGRFPRDVAMAPQSGPIAAPRQAGRAAQPRFVDHGPYVVAVDCAHRPGSPALTQATFYHLRLVTVRRIAQAQKSSARAPAPRPWLRMFCDELAGQGSKAVCRVFVVLGAAPMLGGGVVGDKVSPLGARATYLGCESARPGKRQRRAQHRRAGLLDAGDIDRAQRQLRRLAIGFAKSQGE